MKVFSAALLILITTSQASANSLLQKHCRLLGGNIVKEFTCPKSGLRLFWDFCLTQDNNGRALFFDGCTGPAGGHSEILYPACIKHDYCYHHEPATNGYSQRDCDKQFLTHALELCKQAKNPFSCNRWAKSMYRAVRGFGRLAYNCANYEANYEDIELSKD